MEKKNSTSNFFPPFFVFNYQIEQMELLKLQT